MRALVAGGSGFIGSHLVEALVQRGFQVEVIDDLSTGREENLRAVRSRIQFRQRDVTQEPVDGDFDVLFNFASAASRADWERNPIKVALTNSVGSNNLLRLAAQCKAKYVLASSSEVYGDPEVVPTPEDYPGRVSCVGSRSPYDEGKRFAEALAKAYERELGVKVLILRIFNTYGPRMRQGYYGRVIERFISQATSGRPLTVYGDGRQTRSFCYVSDTIDAILAIQDRGTPGDVYNVGGPNEIPILELAEIVRHVVGRSVPIQHAALPEHDPNRRAPNLSKLYALGWRPTIGLEEGVRRMVEAHVPEQNGQS